MKELIKKAIETYGVKHFTRFLKKENIFLEYLDKVTDKNLPFIERVAQIYFSDFICQYNKNKKFLSITKGYGFCGNAKSCVCLKEYISNLIIDGWNIKLLKKWG